MNEERLIAVLNEAWKLVEPKPKYDEINSKFTVKDIEMLEAIEKANPTLGLSDHEDFTNQKAKSGTMDWTGTKGLTWLSVLATVTDELCGKRLAAIVEDDGTITGWCWAQNAVPKNEATGT